MNDPRAVANCILDCARERGISCSNLKLQKLLYFTHGQWLIKKEQPLISGTFEAWEHGPVHPLIYQAFKKFGALPIVENAKAIDPVTRQQKDIPSLTDIDILDAVRSVVTSLGHLSGSQLRNLTHSPNGPWKFVVENSNESANIGLQISNDVIRKYFGNQIYLLGGGEEEKDLYENAPYSRN